MRSYREMDRATWEIFLEGLYCNALGFEIHGAVHLQDLAAELCLDLLLKQVFGGQVGAEYQDSRPSIWRPRFFDFEF